MITKPRACSLSRHAPAAPTHQLPGALRYLAQDRCPARLGPGAWRDALLLRLRTVVIGVALSWPAVSPGTARGDARTGFAQLKVAVPSLPDIAGSQGEGTGGCDHRDGPAQAVGHYRDRG